MPVIQPTVGRMVLFVPKQAKYEFGFCFVAGREHAAVVTAVHGDRCVNLAAFDANGKSYGFTSVTLVQPDDEATPGGDYCRWMPWQIGQAKAADQAKPAA
jgi:hypothetical protein